MGSVILIQEKIVKQEPLYSGKGIAYNYKTTYSNNIWTKFFMNRDCYNTYTQKVYLNIRLSFFVFILGYEQAIYTRVHMKLKGRSVVGL